MFVTKEAKDTIINKRRDYFVKSLLPDFIDEAAQLSIAKEELIAMIRSEY